jgi:hypothetical protein
MPTALQLFARNRGRVADRKRGFARDGSTMRDDHVATPKRDVDSGVAGNGIRPCSSKI